MRSLIRFYRDPEIPFTSLQRDVNRLFDSFFSGQEVEPIGRDLETHLSHFHPRIDVVENEKEVRVTAELPGLDEKEVEVTLASDTLTLKGEKKSEREEKNGNYYRMERSYGSFHRSIPLPAEVVTEKAEALFRKGVLTVVLPKSVKAQEEIRKLTIKRE
jgi:HSP20 family protein